MDSTNTQTQQFLDKGWTRFPPSPELDAWIAAARPAAAAVATSPEHADWHRHGGTWFVGVNALPNDAAGTLREGPPLAGPAVDFALGLTAPYRAAWDKGQVSICFPGYPQRDPDQSEASHRYRLVRDAAHVDGLHAEGPERRRLVREFHGFILGIPLAAVQEGHSPVVVWEGSHHIMRAAFADALRGVDPALWADVDITETYHAARRRCFESCKRVEVTTAPGQTYVIHRLALHGMAPWTAEAGAPRTVIYFRPVLPNPVAWLADDVETPE